MNRNGWKKGDHLIVDEESGFTIYASKAAYDYYGVLKHINQLDRLHPQDYIKAKEDPYPVYPINPDRSTRQEACLSYVGPYVGTTNVPTPTGPASHLYVSNGIGDMEIECNFYVY